ncbi:MAG: DUF4914 family protein [Thermoanaerobacteraceae bacterium]
MNLPEETKEILGKCRKIIIPESREHLLNISTDGNKDYFEIYYEVKGKGPVLEGTIAKCKNGLAVNFPEPYMRRRESDCLVVADNKETDKPRFFERYGYDFEELRKETFEWLKQQDLIVMPFMSGGEEYGYPSLLVAPVNAGFFATALADIQGFISKNKIQNGFTPKAIVYLAPPFRHTHFNGKQVVVHNRLENIHELFSYNLYLGPSAKKGIYGVLLTMGEKEEWVTAHASAVRVITPYDNILTIMHEGASGGGKSEMLEQIHRESDGSIKVARNIINNDEIYVDLKETCELQPVTDDMALCHPDLQQGKKLVIKDAEKGWFIRVDHINEYGTDPHLEKLCIYPKEPLIFLNIEGAPKSTCLIWEHIMDAPGKPCPNPRVVMPRSFMPNVVDEPVDVDVRSFGVRTPPTSKENPSYGILGIFHLLPPALAWLWRLTAPRGHANPSIVGSEGLESEGVGSYWPFATGKKVTHANLLLNQIVSTPGTRYILVPNQYIGVWKVGFMPEWIAREYLARRGSVRFRPDQVTLARSSLLGYALNTLKINGSFIPRELLQVNKQPEVGNDGYDKGAEMLNEFFKKELKQFLVPELDPLGKKIIETCLDDGSLEDYIRLLGDYR